MIYYVSKNGNDKNSGYENSPFLTIQKAADVMVAGDTVIVSKGVYRECVYPKNGGKGETLRITYKAKDGEKVIIKGSEVVENWEKQGSLWQGQVSNSIFGNENPFATEIYGDWVVLEFSPFLHTSAVYIDGESLKEKLSKEEVLTCEMSYFAEVLEDVTLIYANFGNKNPNEALTEINARQSCFMPEASGINYITVSGFEMAQCATQWAPPTAQQIGLLWARWCKGWIIENNIIHHSRCVAISLGIDKSFGHNETATTRRKPGFTNQLEIVYKALKKGWSKETVGSHIVRNNTIYECGQAGVVGHLGGAFSEICNNHIYNICKEQEFTGFEIAGIKLHAGLDAYIHHNVIHGSRRGMWLDWQAQGVRVSSNLFYDNGPLEDIYVEVTHGPTLLDNNIFNSEKSVKLLSQGNAFINNWLGGTLELACDPKRYTPYHFPHSTSVLGSTIVYGGDDRFYNNVFANSGTDVYNLHPESYEEYMKVINESITMPNNIDVHIYYDKKQPVYIGSNVYGKDASPYEKEKDFKKTSNELKMEIIEENDGIYVKSNLDVNAKCSIINSHNLPVARHPDMPFEDASGNAVIIDKDIANNKRPDTPMAGPLENCNEKTLIFKL